MTHKLTNWIGRDATLDECERHAGLHDRENRKLRVTWINACRTIASRRCPKNHIGASLVTDVDLMLMTPEERSEALEVALKL